MYVEYNIHYSMKRLERKFWLLIKNVDLELIFHCPWYIYFNKDEMKSHSLPSFHFRFNASLSPQREQQAEGSPESSPQQSGSQKSTKPRSRSLIRRTSKKSSKHKDSSQTTPGCNDGDCLVSWGMTEVLKCRRLRSKLSRWTGPVRCCQIVEERK